MNIDIENDIKFIIEDLVPEMVHDRCFCEANSREFIELRSTSVSSSVQEIKTSLNQLVCCVYSAEVTVEFSGIPKRFPIIIKMVPKSVETSKSFGYFLTEEYFYTKILKKHNQDLFPKCYLSNLGKYGRSIIVLENLLKTGYQNIKQELNEKELNFCLSQIGRFHAEGLQLKKFEPDIYREFYNNIYNIQLNEEEKTEINEMILKKLKEMKLNSNEIDAQLSSNPFDALQNYNLKNDAKLYCACHGNLKPSNIFFKYENNEIIQMKIANLEFMKISSIGLHFLTFLLLNEIIQEVNINAIDEYIEPYLNMLNQTHSDISYETIKTEINDAIIFSYVNIAMLNLY